MNKRLRSYLSVAAALTGLLGHKVWAANQDTQDATISVTPVSNVSISLTNTSWAIGNLDVNTSTVSATAMTLTNTGAVDVTVEAQILDESANWVGDATSTMTVNHYMLYVATSAFTPASDGSQFGSGTILGAVGNNIPLAGLSGSGVGTLTTSAAVDLYYRLDMPVTVNTTAARTTHVRFTATGS